MDEDLRDELLKVKARESRYKKEALARIEALERELENYRRAEKSGVCQQGGADASSGENGANNRLDHISRFDAKLRKILELSRQQKELVRQGKDNIEETFLFFTRGESFENALQEVEKINASQGAMLAEILAEIGGKRNGGGSENFALLPYLALACKIAAAKVAEAGEIIRQARDANGLDVLMGSYYHEQADALIAVNEYLSSLLED